MVVNGFELPAAFVKLSEATEREEAPWEWELKERVDAYGHPWENFGLRILTDLKEIEEDTLWMERAFREEHRFPHCDSARNAPSFIQDFTGVSRYVRFGTSPTGEFYCFDFGSDSGEPSVVFWDEGGYWRQVAPNFETFMALFVDSDESAQWKENFDAEAEEMKSPDYSLWSDFAAMVPQYVFAIRAEEQAAFFEQLASTYAKLNWEERQEVEPLVRDRLETQGTTDEERRTLDELWERLRASPPS